jgi:hypothetical protein
MTIFLIVISTILYAPGSPSLFITEEARPINPILMYWMAVRIVESNNRCDTINRSEDAYGCGQIRQPKLDDYNLATGDSLFLADCLEEPPSRKVFVWHCLRYHSIETAVKRWNGSGPATEIYWKKVTKQLLCQNRSK